MSAHLHTACLRKKVYIHKNDSAGLQWQISKHQTDLSDSFSHSRVEENNGKDDTKKCGLFSSQGIKINNLLFLALSPKKSGTS